MKFVLHPWQLLLLALAAWLNRQQQQTIEYLITENQILKEKLGKKRILLNDDQRRRLAVQSSSGSGGCERPSRSSVCIITMSETTRAWETS